MDTILSKNLSELLLPAEKEVPLRKARKSQPLTALDHWTAPILLERAAYLSKMAKYGDGSASETLKEYPQHCVMLSFRSRSGDAEVHDEFADIYFVLDGSATLVIGGALVGATGIGPGETRGSAIVGGTERTLRRGDIVPVPAWIPHQVLVSGEKTVTCMVVKVRGNS